MGQWGKEVGGSNKVTQTEGSQEWTMEGDWLWERGWRGRGEQWGKKAAQL